MCWLKQKRCLIPGSMMLQIPFYPSIICTVVAVRWLSRTHFPSIQPGVPVSTVHRTTQCSELVAVLKPLMHYDYAVWILAILHWWCCGRVYRRQPIIQYRRTTTLTYTQKNVVWIGRRPEFLKERVPRKTVEHYLSRGSDIEEISPHRLNVNRLQEFCESYRIMNIIIEEDNFLSRIWKNLYHM